MLSSNAAETGSIDVTSSEGSLRNGNSNGSVNHGNPVPKIAKNANSAVFVKQRIAEDAFVIQ